MSKENLSSKSSINTPEEGIKMQQKIISLNLQ